MTNISDRVFEQLGVSSCYQDGQLRPAPKFIYVCFFLLPLSPGSLTWLVKIRPWHVV